MVAEERPDDRRLVGLKASDHHRAQLLALLACLAERKRPVVALILKDLSVSTLSALEEFFQQAAKHVTL